MPRHDEPDGSRRVADVDWVVLTLGDRPTELAMALDSLLANERSAAVRVVVVSNGAGRLELPDDDRIELVIADDNLGVPGGRDLGLAHTSAPIVGFLDDDAIAPDEASQRIIDRFRVRERLAAVSLRLVDEAGCSTRRHVPRVGGADPDRSGDVALFLGGASAIRRTAYDAVGGYFTQLWYGHEELELSWRLIDAGWSIEYLADVAVFHPRTPVGRHADGWRLTGRNRVRIARRTLPWPVAVVHVAGWLIVGLLRAPGRDGRRSYLAGWIAGWSDRVDRSPIAWSTVWALTRLGRPPVF